ncbi:MEDS domain-containing protein [Halomicrobium urmianum]|uniref:MEDS domain-containing protein n=1 Tax=Halomicrobium urmianum TaxID=1586233 RepID=UPI001CD92EAC|nr:MEDS domain-containing protein [Halomicrobium urmianum]
MANRERSSDDGPPSDPQVVRDERLCDLRSEFAGTDVDGHFALFYDSRELQLLTAAAFVQRALGSGYRCLYLADENAIADVRAAFRDAGVDVADRIAAGDLEIRAAADVYLEDEFDPDRLIDRLETAYERSLDAEYEGFCAAGENTWSFRTEASFDSVLEFERSFDEWSSDVAVSTLCQYSLDRFDEAAVAKAIRTHPYVLYRGTLCENPYYVPAAAESGSTDTGSEAEFMLQQMRDLAHHRRRIERGRERFSVINRVLRHNIANDLNAVLGRLELALDDDDLDPETRAHVSNAVRIAERMADRADKARHVERTLSNATLEVRPLEAVLDEALSNVAIDHPDAEIALSGSTQRAVLADAHLATAVTELLTNAIVHQDGEPVTVDVTVSAVTDNYVAVAVENPGPSIPENDRRALKSGGESRLDHGSGLGLWLVKWIVENSCGEFRLPGGDGDGSRVEIRLQTIE